MNAHVFAHPRQRPLPSTRGLLRLLTLAACLSFAHSFAALAQTRAPAPLPPAAQEALDKGIIAAKVPDYLLAIRYFEDARKLAPDAPVIFMNLGIAESKIPSRELRAIAWFGAYLAAYPGAPNAAAVKEQIAVLDVRYQSTILRLISSVQDAASQISVDENPYFYVAVLWAQAGDTAAALKTADLIPDAIVKSQTQTAIAEAQAKAGISNPPNAARQSASDWLGKLDSDYGDCPLNTAPFLDLPSYLKSLPASLGAFPDPIHSAGMQKLYVLRDAVEDLITAQNVIHRLLKQQAGK
jgi:hypothetical protein